MGSVGFPHFPPAPSPPAGTKGSLNSRFGVGSSNTVLPASGCGAALRACIGLRGGRSQGLACGRAMHRVPLFAAHDVRASERARSGFLPFDRAEQRSGARIRAGACLSVASLRQTPSGVSSARQPAGPRSSARLFFGYFLLAKQKKVARPQGRNPVFPSFPSKISLSPT